MPKVPVQPKEPAGVWRSIDHPMPVVNLDYNAHADRHYLSDHHEPVDMADFHRFRNGLNESLNAANEQANGIENMTPLNPKNIKPRNDKTKNKRTPKQPDPTSLGLKAAVREDQYKQKKTTAPVKQAFKGKTAPR